MDTSGNLTLVGNIQSNQSLVNATTIATPTDALFVNPQNGMCVIDTLHNKVFFRTGSGVWKFVTIN